MIRKGHAGYAARIREMIAERGPMTCRDIAEGLGLTGASQIVAKMVKDGRLVGQGVRAHMLYAVGRTPRLTRLAPEERLRRLRACQKRANDRKRVRRARERVSVALAVLDAAPARVAVPVAAQTVEEFLAAGGQVERIFSSWERAA